MSNKKIVAIFATVLDLASGYDVLDQSPKQAIPSEQVFTSESNVRGALTGAYTDLQDLAPDHIIFAELILEERRHELLLEGHRWFDLRRFGVAQTVLNISDPNMLLWPIP